MAHRWSRVVYHEDGTASVRLQLEPLIVKTVAAYAEQMKVPLSAAYHAFATQLHLSLKKDASCLGELWAELFKLTRNEAVVQAFTAGQQRIDYERLAKNSKLTSGFVGVYVSGRGFKAMGKDPVTKTETYLGTFDDAAEAAWHRYLHYKKHKMPYGILEDEIDRINATPESQGMTEAEKRSNALEYLRMVKLDHKLEPEEQEEAIANFKAKYPKLVAQAEEKQIRGAMVPNYPRRVGYRADTADTHERIDDRFTHEDGDPEDQ